jgi:flagellar protein FlaG
MITEALGVNLANGAPPQANGAAPTLPSAATRAINASQQTQTANLSAEGLRQVVAAANRAVKSLQNSVQFSLDSQSGEAIVRVVDTETGQLIRQIPTEEVLDLRRALDHIAGLLIKRTA